MTGIIVNFTLSDDFKRREVSISNEPYNVKFITKQVYDTPIQIGFKSAHLLQVKAPYDLCLGKVLNIVNKDAASWWLDYNTDNGNELQEMFP